DFDAFVARLNTGLTALDQATYLGGGSVDTAQALAIAPTSGDVYVAALTASTVFPGTTGGPQIAFAGPQDATVARVSAGLSNTPTTTTTTTSPTSTSPASSTTTTLPTTTTSTTSSTTTFPSTTTTSSSTTTTIPANTCPVGQGFWKNHPSAWPVGTLMLGSQTYTEGELLGVLRMRTGGDASLKLAHQLIAAQLSIANGADPTT